MIHRTPFFLPWLYPGLTWRMDEAPRTLYLTFDDGPVPGPTEFVIETLREKGVRGTFFCIGDNVQKHPAVFQSLIADGHAVGNHTFHHLNGWKTSTQAYLDNVGACAAVLGAQPSLGSKALFRPPYGRITRAQIRALNSYNIVMWDVLTMDYRRTLGPERCLENTLAATRDGSIVVFHDSVKAEKNLRYVLPRYIDHCQSRGYRFHTLTSR